MLTLYQIAYALIPNKNEKSETQTNGTSNHLTTILYHLKIFMATNFR